MKLRLREIKEQGAPQPVSGAIGSEPVRPQTEKHCASLPTSAHVPVPSYDPRLHLSPPQSPEGRATASGPLPTAHTLVPCLPLWTLWSPADRSPGPGELGFALSLRTYQVLVGPRGHGQTPAGKEQGPRLPLSWLGKWASSIWASLGAAGERSLSSTSLQAPSFSLPVLSLRLGLDLRHPILFITHMSTP